MSYRLQDARPPYPSIQGLDGRTGWQLGRLVFGPSLLEPVALAIRAAPRDQPVLITGESGTGKELVAELIHGHSPRRDRPFIALNCGSIPGELVESELFGHVRGAYTNALTGRPGSFAAAHSGSLFLDELGELPLRTQPSLLRALETGRVRPVGTELERAVDVRVIAATHRDLYAEAADGRFRHDLVYRLDVLRVHLPPLRERADELPLLVPVLLEQVGAPRDVTRAALRRLAAHPWPGNVRELRNVLVRAAQLADHRIDSGHVDAALARCSGQAPELLPSFGGPGLREVPPREVLYHYAEAALRHSDNRPTRAAEAIGVPRSTFYRWLKLGRVNGAAMDANRR